ncbi:hypothetical protein M0805_001197 [Coniferiporia weirii]|nr:hypothetical protein M0805_001197 [Coniferiporia weirii]
MIKSSDHWLEDGSVLLIADGVIYKTYYSLLARLSPNFFDKYCHTPILKEIHEANVDLSVTKALADGIPCFVVNPGLQVSKDDFDSLMSHIHHVVQARTLADDTSFAYILRLFVVTAPSKFDFESIHRAVTRRLKVILFENPLEVDYNDWKLLKKSFYAADKDLNPEVKVALGKALYYSYTIHPEITFEEVSPESNEATQEIITDLQPDTTSSHISGAEAVICERLMTKIAEYFSSILFQPPAALHMECTDVYASLWMERAVQPAISENGTANPFATLRRLRSLDWRRETSVNGGLPEPCEECLKQKRDEWEEEALTIWKLMDAWLKA